MKNIFRILFLTSVLLIGLIACSVEESLNAGADEKMPQISEGVVSGELLVCFDPYVSSTLEKASPVSTPRQHVREFSA